MRLESRHVATIALHILLEYMKGWVSKGERLKIAERRRRGKLRKAREGRIIGEALQPRYGFKYMRNAEGKAVGYEVDLKKMANVRMISRC